MQATSVRQCLALKAPSKFPHSLWRMHGCEEPSLGQRVCFTRVRIITMRAYRLIVPGQGFLIVHHAACNDLYALPATAARPPIGLLAPLSWRNMHACSVLLSYTILMNCTPEPLQARAQLISIVSLTAAACFLL